MTLNAAQSLLYVVEDQSDTVDVIDTRTNAILETIPVISTLSSSLSRYTGANPNSATLSPDERHLYVTNGNLNCIAVVALGGTNRDDHVVGLIPTGWYPNSVSLQPAMETMYMRSMPSRRRARIPAGAMEATDRRIRQIAIQRISIIPN